MYFSTVVPKRSRDSVSDDVAFRRPAVELLVTMHGWALPCHTKSGFRKPSSTSYWLKLYHDVFDASTHHIAGVAAECINFRGVMAFFLISPQRQIALTACFVLFFLSYGGQDCWSSSIKCHPKISESNSSIYSPENGLPSARTAGWTSS